MALTINKNLMAMNASRNLRMSYGGLGVSTRRLSSGLRVGVAADDAAGLAIRELMRADVAALNQGVRNANDGISLIQTADGALQTIDDKLIRMKELAEQAATGSYNATQRAIIDSEYQAMASEITRIANAVDFNGVNLLNGNLTASPENLGNPADWIKDYDGLGGYYAKVGSDAANAYIESVAAEYRAGVASDFANYIIDAYDSTLSGTPVHHAAGDAFNATLDNALLAGIASNAAIDLAVAAQSAVIDAERAASNAAIAASTLAAAAEAAATASNAAINLGLSTMEAQRLAGIASNAAIQDARDRAGVAAAAESAAIVGAAVAEDVVIVSDSNRVALAKAEENTDLNGVDMKIDPATPGAMLDLTARGPLVIHFGTGSSMAEDYYTVTIGNATASALGVGNTVGQLNDEGRAQIEVDTATAISETDIANGQDRAYHEVYAATFEARIPIAEGDVYDVTLSNANGTTNITRDEAIAIAEIASQTAAEEFGGIADGAIVTEAEIAAASNAVYEATLAAASAAGATGTDATNIAQAAADELREQHETTRTYATDIALVAADAVSSNLEDQSVAASVSEEDIAESGQTIYDATYSSSIDTLEEDSIAVVGAAASAAATGIGLTAPQSVRVGAVAAGYMTNVYEDAREKAGLTAEEIEFAADEMYARVYTAAIDEGATPDNAREVALATVDVFRAEFEEVDTAARAIAEAGRDSILIDLEDARAEATPDPENIAGANISSQENAQQALDALNAAIVSKDLIRASLGSLQNRLQATVENLQIQAENLQASESRISDVDVSIEMTEFTRRQITSQAATAMLSQANSLPRMAMQLIGG